MKKHHAALKTNLGAAWIPSTTEDFPSWDILTKAPIWASEKWGSFRMVIGKPLSTVLFNIAPDGESTRLELDERTVNEEGDEIGSHVRVFHQSVQAGIPRDVVDLPFGAVCVACLGFWFRQMFIYLLRFFLPPC